MIGNTFLGMFVKIIPLVKFTGNEQYPRYCSSVFLMLQIKTAKNQVFHFSVIHFSVWTFLKVNFCTSIFNLLKVTTQIFSQTPWTVNSKLCMGCNFRGTGIKRCSEKQLFHYICPKTPRKPSVNTAWCNSLLFFTIDILQTYFDF